MSLQGGWTLRPERRDVVVSLRWAVFLTVLFLAVYLGCNWITSQRAGPYRLWFDWELDIPFVPAMVRVYFSLFVGFFLPMFALREPALTRMMQGASFHKLGHWRSCWLDPTGEVVYRRRPGVSGGSPA